MTIRWLRLVGAALVAEAVPIGLLVGLVAALGPTDPEAAQAFASRWGAWVGPIGGAIVTFLLAIWVARPLAAGHAVHGGLLGLFVAVLDAALLVVGASAFEWLFVFSGAGRIVAGLLGGYLASKIGTGSRHGEAKGY
jgi:hypothetical protein